MRLARINNIINLKKTYTYFVTNESDIRSISQSPMFQSQVEKASWSTCLVVDHMIAEFSRCIDIFWVKSHLTQKDL